VTSWTFLAYHARVLLLVAHDPGVGLRDIAASLNITERSAFGIITDLAEAGYVVKEKNGRRNRYHVQAHLPLPEPDGQETHRRGDPGPPDRHRRARDLTRCQRAGFQAGGEGDGVSRSGGGVVVFDVHAGPGGAHLPARLTAAKATRSGPGPVRYLPRYSSRPWRT
jgi:hypothetical protein